jgi:hypothetical protein
MHQLSTPLTELFGFITHTAVTPLQEHLHLLKGRLEVRRVPYGGEMAVDQWSL